MTELPKYEAFLVEGPPSAWKFWCGEASGDTTRISSGKFGKPSRASIDRHRDEAAARAHVDAQAAKQAKKGLAPVLSRDDGSTIAVPVVARGSHAHEGARLLVRDKSTLCAVCGSEIDVVEVSEHRLAAALLPSLAFPRGMDARAIGNAEKLAAALADLPPGSVWQSRSLFAGKPKPVKKAAKLSPADERTSEVFRRLLDRTAGGEALLDVFEDLLLRSGPSDAAVAAGLLHGVEGGLRPVAAFNPAVQPSPALAWRLQQIVQKDRAFLADVADRVAVARLLLRAAEHHGGEVLAAVGSPLLSTRVWDWLSGEDHDAARRLAVRLAEDIVAMQPGTAAQMPLAFAGCADVAQWWSFVERAPSAYARVALVRVFARSPWPDGPASLMVWLDAHPYDAPGRKEVLDTLESVGHPDKAAFAFTRVATPDDRPHWIPYEVRGKPEQWPAYRAEHPWPLREKVASGVDVTEANLSELASELWSVTGRHLPRREVGGSPRDPALREAWRSELLAAAADASIAPIDLDRGAGPDASAHRAKLAREREEHADLHRRAAELAPRFGGTRLGAAWVGALEPGAEGTRHRSAIFGRAILEALEPDVEACTGCALQRGKRNISLRLGAAVRFTPESEDAKHGIEPAERPRRRDDWGSFRSTAHRRLEIPLRFIVWDLETYLDEVEPIVSAEGVDRLVRLLALWDSSLARKVEYDAEVTIPRAARHLVGDPSVSSEPLFEGAPGFGLLAGIPALEAEMLVRALLAPPFFDDQAGMVRDALLGTDGMADFRAAPRAPFPPLFADEAARAEMVASLEVGRSEDAAHAPAGEPRELVLEGDGARLLFRFDGPMAAERFASLAEHVETSWSEAASETTARGALYRFELDLDAVLDHLLDMSDSAGGVLDAVLRQAVEEAIGAGDDAVIDVR